MNLLMIVIKSSHEANLKLYTRFRDYVKSLLNFRQICVNRLLTENMLSRSGGLFDQIRVRVRRGADKNSVNTFVLNNNIRIRIAVCHAKLPRPVFCVLIQKWIRDSDQFRVLYGTNKIRSMSLRT